MRAFTIVEILIVIALLSIIVGFSLVVSFDQYRGDSLRAERRVLVAVLQHARSEAIDGVCMGTDCTAGASHGVAIQADNYVLFQGDSFATRDQSRDVSISANAAMQRGGVSEIAFAPFSGDAIENGAIVLTDPNGKTATITAESDGRITWSD